jgi:hypothetical protein
VQGRVVLLGHLDVEQITALVIHLEGRVLQVEVVVQHPLQATARGVAVVLRTDEYVR